MPIFIGATPAPLRDRIKGSRINKKGNPRYVQDNDLL